MADGEEDTGGVGVNASGELVSPDSGMTTIRSSRSSKESSVFLSDDSPVGEVIGGGGSTAGPGGHFLRNPSPLGLPSLSPPVPPERRRHHSTKIKSDNFDLFSFDPLHTSDSSPPPAGSRSADSGGNVNNGRRTAGSSSLSEYEELSMLDLSAPNSLGMLESRHSATDQHGKIHGNDMTDTVVPPTPVNSLVGSRPSSSCGVRFFPEDVVERINALQHKDSVSSSLSETWEELGFDTQGALSSNDSNVWNRTKGLESPRSMLEEVRGEESTGDMSVKESREKMLRAENAQQRGTGPEPWLSLITKQPELHDNWNPDSALKNQWNPVTLADLQLTPPEEEVIGKHKIGITRVKETTSLWPSKKAILNTLTPDTSKEEDEEAQGKKGGRQMELLDFWTYSAQKGFLKSDSATTTSYPESLDMWNMTIRDDSISPLTTPDNMSENSASFGVGVVQSPQGLSDGGMEMWNTTIQEDSSSTTTTSPEGPENGRSLCHTGSWDAGDTPETCATNQADERAKDVERDKNKALSQTPGEMMWGGNEHSLKIVIEAAEDRTQGEETRDDDIQGAQRQNDLMQSFESEHQKDETFLHQGSEMSDLLVPSMVVSTSEYDNIGASCWSLASSPDTFTSQALDMIQLEEQSSPFLAVTKPTQLDEGHEPYEMSDPSRKTEYGDIFPDKDLQANQVFLFENDQKSAEGLEKADGTEQLSVHSPFVMVDNSVTQPLSGVHHPEIQIQTDQSSSPSLLNWDNLPSSKHDGSGSVSLLPITVAHHHGFTIESQEDRNIESNGNVEGTTAGSLSLSSSSGGERDTLKYSPDGLHPGSQDELRSNSDGDSSSGLEMEYIIVSGTVKEAEREWNYRPKESDRQSRGTRKSMETFSMLSYAATVLKAQAQAAQREHHDNPEQSRQAAFDATNKHSTDKTYVKTAASHQSSCDQQACSTSQSFTDSIQSRGHGGNVTDHHRVPEIFSPSQSKTDAEAFQSEEGSHDDKSNILVRSLSPSLRYPSDHFLKTREEVYVHSQISMEDSDDGGQSPSPSPSCPTSLGNIQVWGGQLAVQDTPQSPCEPKSLALTNSSVSHTSSLISTPLSEKDISSTERGLGLPFSGDLMEEENGGEEQEEGTDAELTIPPGQTSGGQSQQLGSHDLLSFSEELIEGCSYQQTYLQTLEPEGDMCLQDTVDDCDGQPMRTVDCDKWSAGEQFGGHGSSQENHSPVLR